MRRAFLGFAYAIIGAHVVLSLAWMFLGPDEDLLGMIVFVLMVLTGGGLVGGLMVRPPRAKLGAEGLALAMLVLVVVLSPTFRWMGVQSYFRAHGDQYRAIVADQSRLRTVGEHRATGTQWVEWKRDGIHSVELDARYVAILHAGFLDNLNGFIYVPPGTPPPAIDSAVFEARLVRLRALSPNWYYFSTT